MRRTRGIPAASLWASVPHYVAAAPNPKAALALLRRSRASSASRSTDPSSRRRPPTTSARSALAVQSDPDVQAFVERLEQLAEDERGEAQDIPSGDRLAREFQRFLRQRGAGTDQ